MIITGLSEDKILEELLADQKIVAKEAKKFAKKKILQFQKAGRDGIDEVMEYTVFTTTARNNKWFDVVSINMANNPKWYHQSVCYVNTDQGYKDYYLLRGLSNNHPYFINVTSHTIKRIKERLITERLKCDYEFENERIASMVIAKGEIITWMVITDPRYIKTVLDSKDRHTFNTLYYTMCGCFLGYESEKGNIFFQTFLNNNKELKTLEENLALSMCHLTHAANNRKLYTKKYIKELENDDTPSIPPLIYDLLMEYKDLMLLLP